MADLSPSELTADAETPIGVSDRCHGVKMSFPNWCRHFLSCLTPAMLLLSVEAFSKEPPAKAVRCCGVILRTEFGHPEKMAEFAVEPDSVLATCIDLGKMKGLVEAFDVYFDEIDAEFGDATQRDVVRSRLREVFKSVANDPARAAQLMEGFRKFSFASVLASKGLQEKGIEEVKQSRTVFLKAVPADSFCLMPVDLYLATSLADAGDGNEAVTVAQSVGARARKKYGDSDEFVGLALAGLSKALLAADKPAQAEESIRASMQILANSLEIQPGAYLMNCKLWVDALVAQSKHAEIAEVTAYLDPQLRKLFKNQYVGPVFEVVGVRANALVTLKKYEEAEKILGRYPEIAQSLREPGDAGRNLVDAYVKLLEKTNRADQATEARKFVAKFDAKKTQTSRKNVTTDRK